MHWILQENMFNERAYDDLIAVLEQGEFDYSLHKVVPFVGELHPDPSHLMGELVICFGSYSMRHAATKYMWEPGVFDIESEDFTQQLSYWGSHMLNYDSKVVTFAQAELDQPLTFIRPILDSKSFSGKVFTKGEFEEWQYKVCSLGEDYGDTVNGDTVIQLSQPKVIYSEYRFWVVKGNIATASMYKRGNKLMVMSINRMEYPELYSYVDARVAEWQPHDAFCIDICDTPVGLKIVEINTLNACGLYAADVQRLVYALHDAFGCEGEYVPPVDSKRWHNIVAIGCAAGHDSYTNESYCGHDYTWSCDECPVFDNKRKKENDAEYCDFSNS